MGRPINFQVAVPVGPKWKNVELLRSSILNCLAAIFHDSDVTHQVSIVAGELLENAVKYGDWTSKEHTHFDLRVWGDAHSVHVEVSNPAKPDSKAVDELFHMVKWLEGFPSAQDAYQARLRQLADGETGDTGSQLGLARILYEGDCVLDANFTDGIVRIRATVATGQAVAA